MYYSDEITKRKPNIYDGEYFQILNQQNELLLVQCLACGPEVVKLRSTIKSNGNILKHIQRRHPQLLDTIRISKNIRCRSTPKPTIIDGKMYIRTPPSITTSHDGPSSQSNLIIDSSTREINSLTEYKFMPTITNNNNNGNNNDPLQSNLKFKLSPTINDNDSNDIMEGIDDNLSGDNHESHNATASNHCDDHQDFKETGEYSTNYSNYIDRTIETTTTTTTVGDCDSREIDDIVETTSTIEAPLPTNNNSLHHPDDTTLEQYDSNEEQRQEQYHQLPRYFCSNKINTDTNRELIELQKQLLQQEFHEIQDMRRQRHRYEIEILQRELEFKKLEHSKKLALLDRKLLCEK